MANWTLSYGNPAVSQTFAAAGLSGLTRRLVSQGADEVTCQYPGGFDVETPLAFESQVTIQRDAVPWFFGVVTSIPRQGSGSDESTQLRLVGPWYYLEQMIFQQGWTYIVGAKPVVVGYTSHLLLNYGGAGLVTTGTQIRAVLQYVLDQFAAAGRTAPFQIGQITPAIYPAIDEVRDMTCAEVIRKQLRWHPDAVTWFDYTTTPPTFHCKLRAELAGVTLKLASLDPSSSRVSAFDATPRYDLVRPAVAIKYEKKTTIDSKDYLSVTNDIYPLTGTGREVGALTATIDLQGAKLSNLRGALTVDAIPGDLLNALGWWKRKVPELNDERIANITVEAVGRVVRNADGTTTNVLLGGSLPNEVIEGQVAPWMGIQAQQEELSIQVRYDLYNAAPDAAGAVKVMALEKPQVYTVKLVTTDGVSGDYKAVGSLEASDPQPVGLAQALWTALQVIHYEGSCELTSDEAGDVAIGLGNNLNVAGGRAEWAGMLALVQGIEEDVDRGIARAKFGPPAHLGPTDLVELLRVNRSRMRYTNPNSQSSGNIAGGDVSLGKQTANANRGAGDQIYNLFVVKSGDTRVITLDATAGIVTVAVGAAGQRIIATLDAVNAQFRLRDEAHPNRQITGDLANCRGSDGNDHAVVLKETIVCENIGGVPTARKAIVWRSDSYA